MSRREQQPHAEHHPAGPEVQSDMLAKFMNVVMESGKKSAAERIIYGALDRITEKTGKPGTEAIERAVARRSTTSSPVVEVKSAASAARPTRCRLKFVHPPPDTGHALGDRGGARAQREVDGAFRLAHELLDAAENRGAAVRKREDTHRMAEANKAFAHYRW
jgi:small subunit ribosomal protein S7